MKIVEPAGSHQFGRINLIYIQNIIIIGNIVPSSLEEVEAAKRRQVLAAAVRPWKEFNPKN